MAPATRFLTLATILALTAGHAASPAQAPIALPAIPDPQAAEVGEPPDEADQEPESEDTPVGRLLITSDAAATISVDGEDLGVLQPEDTLEYEVSQAEGEIKAVSLEATGAQVRKPYLFEEPLPEVLAAKDEATELQEISVHFRMLRAIRQLRKTERQEKMFPDFRSDVMWAREDNRSNVTWRAAREYCAELDLGGWRDWRLPDIEQLESLQAMWSQAAFKTADPIKLTECCPWSSTEIDEQKAWNFNFRFRKQFEGFKGHSFGMRALCIRDLTEAEITEHEEALAERERKKKEDKKRKKAIKKGDLEEEAEPIEDDGLAPADPPRVQ